MINGWNQVECQAYHVATHVIDEWDYSRKRDQWGWEMKSWAYDSQSLKAISWSCSRLWKRSHGHYDSKKSHLRRKIEFIRINTSWARLI